MFPVFLPDSRRNPHACDAASPAAVWFHRAAEQGVVQAQVILATMFTLGKGVSTDNVAAYSWSSIAADGVASSKIGKDAMALRQSLTKLMTLEQITAAEKIVKAWKPKS